MMRRLLDAVAPVRPAGKETGYRRLLRWAALPVTNRRWAAPLAALALGFGLFAGVAIGPGASGTLATGAPQIVELPSLLATSEGEDEETEVEGGTEESTGGGEADSLPSLESESASLAPSYVEPESEEPSESNEAPPAKETEEKEEAPEAEEAQVISGVVVHANPAAGSYTVSESGGLLNAIHAAKLPAPGAKISVPVRTLANGTFAEVGARKQTGRQTRASFQGIVTFVDADPLAPSYAVSKRGVSVLVQIHPDPTGALPVLPQLGAYASATVEIEMPQPEGVAAPLGEAPVPGEVPPPCAPDPAAPLTIPAPAAVLWQQKLDADGAPFASSDFEGVVTAICPGEGMLRLSADDLRASGKDLLFSVPKSIDIGKLKLGDSVAATAEIEATGGLMLTGLAGDERTKGADDAGATQGDLASHKPK